MASRLLPLLVDEFGGHLLEMLFVRDGTQLPLPALLAGFLREHERLKAVRPCLIMHLADVDTRAYIVLFGAVETPDIYRHQCLSLRSFLSSLWLAN